MTIVIASIIYARQQVGFYWPPIKTG